jgi:nicotinate-nucleotide adenylyltransferase
MLGIYGGTFDPIHYGHLRTAVEVKALLSLAELRFLPCRQPPHRGTPGASAEQRLAMLAVAVALADAEPGFALDSRELRRAGPSYMVDTLSSLREEFPGRPLCLILGLDAFCGLTSWHRWRDLFELAHLAVMRRPDAAVPSLSSELADILGERSLERAGDLHRASAGNLVFLEVTQLAISATEIRRLIREGKSPRYLLPDAVLGMIRAQGLYRGI